MESLVQQIKAAYEAFQADAALQLEKNNKAAGTRARKASLEARKTHERIPQSFARTG